MKHELTIGHPPTHPSGTYPCKGDYPLPHSEDRYHPEQEAWLRRNNLYTGRMVVDVAYLPEDLKFL